MLHSFVAGYMHQVQDCHMTEIGFSSLAISCSSSEILSNATAALEQVRVLSIWLSLHFSGCIY